MPAPIDKEKKKKIKSELEDLLSQYGNGERLEEEVVNQQLQEIIAAPPINFEEMNRKFMDQAREITASVFDFYVKLGLVDQHDYVKLRKQIDESNLHNIFFQITTIKFAIEKIMQEINAGSTHPRLFEVMGQLQDKLANAVKTQANYVLFLEDSYKKVKSDIENRGDAQQVPGNSPDAIPTSGEFVVTVGTKSMAKMLGKQPVVNPLELQAEAVLQLTNPSHKNDLMEERGLGHLRVLEEQDDVDFSDELEEII